MKWDKESKEDLVSFGNFQISQVYVTKPLVSSKLRGKEMISGFFSYTNVSVFSGKLQSWPVETPASSLDCKLLVLVLSGSGHHEPRSVWQPLLRPMGKSRPNQDHTLDEEMKLCTSLFCKGILNAEWDAAAAMLERRLLPDPSLANQKYPCVLGNMK